MGLPMTRHLVEAGHHVTVASRSRGPIEAALAFGARRGRRTARRRRRERHHDPVRAELARGRRGPRRRAAGARCREDRRRHVDHRPRGRAGAARPGHRDRCRLPRGAALGRDRRRAEGNPDAHGGRRRGHARPGAPRARAVRRPDRARRRPGHGPGRQALQQPHLRRADARDRRGDGDGRAGRRRPRAALRGADARDGRLRRGADAPPGRGRRSRQPGLERLGARLHDRPHGQGPRPRDRVRGRRGAVRCSRRGSCARSSVRRARPATAARTSRRWPRSSGSSPARSGRTPKMPEPEWLTTRSSPSTWGRARPRARCGARAGWSRSPARRSTPRTPSRAGRSRTPSTGGRRSSTVCDELRAVARSDVEAVARGRVLGRARDLRVVRRGAARARTGDPVVGPSRRGHRVDVRRRERVPVAHRRGAERRVARGEARLGGAGAARPLRRRAVDSAAARLRRRAADRNRRDRREPRVTDRPVCDRRRLARLCA